MSRAGIVLFALLPLVVVAQSIPENASPNAYSGGWSCDRGYAQSGNHCVKVIPPENASLNYAGNGWQCNRGYRQSGLLCVQVTIPENANLNYVGNGWQCDRDYAQSGGACTRIVVPENASLNYLGNGWQCNSGYIESGTSCSKLVLPSHSHLDWSGHAWTCDKGFKAASGGCLEITAREMQKQNEQTTALMRAVQRRRTQTVSGENCDEEDQTGARVCVTVSNSQLECHKNFDESQYSGCDVTVDYELETDYEGRSSLDATVDCAVELSYSGRNTPYPKTDSESDTSSHTLMAHDSDNGTIEVSFSFLSYHEVIRAKIISVECRVSSIDLL